MRGEAKRQHGVNRNSTAQDTEMKKVTEGTQLQTGRQLMIGGRETIGQYGPTDRAVLVREAHAGNCLGLAQWASMGTFQKMNFKVEAGSDVIY